MRIRHLLDLCRLAVRRQLAQPRRAAVAVASIALSVALVVAVLGLYSSFARSTAASSARSPRASVVVVASTDAGFGKELAGEVATVEGVVGVIEIVRGDVQIGDERLTLVGVGEAAFAEFELDPVLARPPRSVDAAVVALPPGAIRELGLEAGDNVKAVPVSGAATTRMRVVELLGGGPLRGVNGGMVAVSTLATARAALGLGNRTSELHIVATEGVDSLLLRDRLTGVLGGRAVAELPDVEQQRLESVTESFRRPMQLIAALAAIVALLLVVNGATAAAAEQRTALATLSAIGTRPATIVGRLVLETVVVTTVGAVAGAAIGVVAGRVLVSTLPEIVTSSISTRVVFSLQGWAVVVVVVAAVLVAAVAAIVPARMAARVPPAVAMRPGELMVETSTRLRSIAPRVGAGVTVVVGTVLAFRGGDRAAGLALVVLLAGGLLLAWSVALHALAVAATGADRLGAAGKMAGMYLRHAPRSAWVAVAAVVLATGASVATAGLVSNAQRSAAENLATLGAVDLFVSSAPGSSLPLDAYLPLALEEELRSIPGVTAAIPGQFAFTVHNSSRILLQGYGDEADLAPAFRQASPGARRALIAGEGAIISEGLADRERLGEGDEVRLETPSGPHSLPVLAVVESFTWPNGLVGLPLRALHEWYDRPGAGYFEVQVVDGADLGAARAAVERIAEAVRLPVYVQTGHEYLHDAKQTVGQLGSALGAMQGAVCAGAAMIVLTTLTASVQRRTRALGILRAVGSRARTIRRAVMLEATAIGLVGGIGGAVTGLGLHRAAVAAVGATTRLPIRYREAPWTLALALAVAAAVAAVGAVGPARRAGRLDVVQALAWE